MRSPSENPGCWIAHTSYIIVFGCELLIIMRVAKHWPVPSDHYEFDIFDAPSPLTFGRRDPLKRLSPDSRKPAAGRRRCPPSRLEAMGALSVGTAMGNRP